MGVLLTLVGDSALLARGSDWGSLEAGGWSGRGGERAPGGHVTHPSSLGAVRVKGSPSTTGVPWDCPRKQGPVMALGVRRRETVS